MTTERKRAAGGPASDRNGVCRATTRQGQPCRKQALGAEGLCLVHAGGQDMRELGRKGGKAIPKAKRADARRESLREFLRREVDPAAVWEAIRSSLASSNERDRLAGAKLLLSELYEPAVERQRESEAEAARVREKLRHAIDRIAARKGLEQLIERGLIRPGPGRPFAGVVKFELGELAEWAGAWTPRPVTVDDVTCGTCGKAGVRIVAEGETVDAGPVYCATCGPEREGEAEASSPGPAVASPERGTMTTRSSSTRNAAQERSKFLRDVTG